MKISVAIILSLLIGFYAGWVSFRNKELSDFRRAIDEAGITEEQLVEAYRMIPAMLDNMEADDRMAAVIALSALRVLEDGKIVETKQALARQVASYYYLYGPPDSLGEKTTEERMKTLEAIEKARQNSPTLDAAIIQVVENRE